MKAVRNLVGPTLRKLRYQRKLSQADFAARCQRLGWNISRDIVAAIEGQLRSVNDAELVGLAIILGVPESELYCRSVEKLFVPYRISFRREGVVKIEVFPLTQQF